MDKYLLKSENVYRVPTVEDALLLREELQQIDCGELISFSYTTKYTKVKGEIIDEYQVVKAKIQFTDEKEPEEHTKVSYERGF